MEIRELEKAIRRLVRTEHPRLALATLSGSLPGEFAVAAGTLADRAHDQSIVKRAVQAATKPWN